MKNRFFSFLSFVLFTALTQTLIVKSTFAQEWPYENIAKEFKYKGLKYQILNVSELSGDSEQPYYNEVVVRKNGRRTIISKTLSNRWETTLITHPSDNFFNLLGSKNAITGVIGSIKRSFWDKDSQSHYNSQVAIISVSGNRPKARIILDRQIARELLKACHYDLPEDVLGFHAGYLDRIDYLKEHDIWISWTPYISYKHEAHLKYNVEKDFLYITECPQI